MARSITALVVGCIMIPILASMLACLVCIGPVTPSNGTIQNDIVDSYVEIRTEYGGGAGTVIKVGDDVFVLTAAHVVEENARGLAPKTDEEKRKSLPQRNQAVKIAIETKHRRIYITADIVCFSPTEDKGGTDLALIKPRDSEGLKAATFSADATLEPGQDCWYIGTPMGVHRMLERTIINRPEILKADHPYIVANGSGTYGNSGGGLFVKSGDRYLLVGVVTQRLWTEDQRNPICAQTQQSIKKFLDKYAEETSKKEKSP